MKVERQADRDQADDIVTCSEYGAGGRIRRELLSVKLILLVICPALIFCVVCGTGCFGLFYC